MIILDSRIRNLQLLSNFLIDSDFVIALRERLRSHKIFTNDQCFLPLLS